MAIFSEDFGSPGRFLLNLSLPGDKKPPGIQKRGKKWQFLAKILVPPGLFIKL